MSQGQDEADGALFSRVSSKQADIDKSAQSKPGKGGHKSHDHADVASFTRRPSQKSDMKMSTLQGQKSGQIVRESDNLECTIKPEDLSDSDSEEEQKPKIIPEQKKPLLKAKKDKNKINERSNQNKSSTKDDIGDAIQGSRVSLRYLVKEDEVQEIQPSSSSKFYSQPEIIGKNCLDGSKSNSDSVKFYLQDSETERVNSSNTSQNKSEYEKRTPTRSVEGKAYEQTNCLHDQNASSNSKRSFEDTADKTAHAPNSDNSNSKRLLYWRLFKALLFPATSLFIYIWDIGSDIRLAVSYRESGDLNLFWITLGCIVIPHLLMTVVDVSWVWLDRGCGSMNIRRFILGSLTLGRILRALKYMSHIYKTKTMPKVNDDEKVDGLEPKHGKTRTWHKDRAREEKRDCFMLDFINAFAESAPQLFVQLYLYYAYDLELTFLRVANLLSSWISIAWTYAAYYRCNREALKGEQDVNIIGLLFFFCSVLSALAARYVCTTLFLVYFDLLIGLVCIAIHFVIMMLWIFIKERPKLEGTAFTAFGRYLFYIFFAYVCILCFMNLNDTRARIRMTIFYILIYVENVIMAALASWKMSETGSEKLMHLVILPVGFIVHVVLLVNYYKCLHPQTGICYNCGHPRNSDEQQETAV